VSKAHVIHPALWRPVLFGGAEPSVVIVEVAAVVALLFVVGVHLATVVLAAVYGVGVHGVAQRLTASDPQISVIYLRSLAGQDYYPAVASVWASGQWIS
jgi:type IV secretory pathway TrbD component